MAKVTAKNTKIGFWVLRMRSNNMGVQASIIFARTAEASRVIGICASCR